ncbi:DUF2953 domain-containing protein [uncultured Clostridium sp.]|uniref:DUF2953 domain-containing protein n=1 Tax=uncultured Clostridium sp. TaxID=59620 RepID=UPI00344F93B8
MNVIFFIFLILLCIIFIPIPFKFHISFINSKLHIKLYKFNIYPKPGNKEKGSKVKSIKKRKKKSSFIKKEDFSIPLIKKVFLDLNSRRFKPSFTLLGYTNYSLGDSKKTALSFGIIHSFCPFIFNAIRILFVSKNNNFKIIPVFKDTIFFETDIKCIMKVSLGQLIYIGFIFIKNVYIKRRCSL